MAITNSLITLEIEPKNIGDEDKMRLALDYLSREDDSLSVSLGEEEGKFILGGVDELHLETAIDKLKRAYNLEVNQGSPQIVYYETIQEYTEIDHAYTHKKQSGGAGQYAQIKAKMRRSYENDELNFINRIVAGSIPREYIPSVKRGFLESIKSSIIAGYPVMGIEIELYDGAYHDVDSSALAFEICARNWFLDAMRQLKQNQKVYLVEPIMNVEVCTPMEYQANIAASLSSRRGSITDTELGANNSTIIKADVPLAEMIGYIQTLRGITQGRATFSMVFGFYEKVPSHIQDSLANDL